MDIEINLNLNPNDMLKDQLESGELKLSKADGRTIEDYLILDANNKPCLPPTYMGYEVLDITEDKENIIIKVGKKLYDWKPKSYDFNFHKRGE